VELLVASISVQTTGEGQRRQAMLIIAYTYGPGQVVNGTTGIRNGNNYAIGVTREVPVRAKFRMSAHRRRRQAGSDDNSTR